MNSEVEISCQRFEIQNNGMTYSYYLGALDAKKLKLVSGAPSFEYGTPNEQIAHEVLSPPTQHWQRPLKAEKVLAIAERFDMPGEIMPNPVLLAVNPNKRALVSVKPEED